MVVLPRKVRPSVESERNNWIFEEAFMWFQAPQGDSHLNYSLPFPFPQTVQNLTLWKFSNMHGKNNQTES